MFYVENRPTKSTGNSILFPVDPIVPLSYFLKMFCFLKQHNKKHKTKKQKNTIKSYTCFRKKHVIQGNHTGSIPPTWMDPVLKILLPHQPQNDNCICA
eukprot:m.257159 g.257159  ORF g.257159 m.257159 type:complete len:98 (-) comp35013_c0_seq1:53-346(-)